MWESTVDGQQLTFSLSALNNQNFIMKDAETGSWWQQVTGEAIRGPLRGKRLNKLSSELASWKLWSEEHPETWVLRPDPNQDYSMFDQGVVQHRTAENMMPFVGQAQSDAPLERGELVAGIHVDGRAKAYPYAALVEQSPIVDRVAGRPLWIALADDGETVRCFEREVDGQTLEFFRDAESDELRFVDAQTGSRWNFSGRAVEGPLAGTQLVRLDVTTEFWFDWEQFNPETRVYSAGIR